ncbi:hypothetical protein SAMN03159341_11787 [Paenibacillus sp. 1_12]|uniref:hypothetical protein n=1 Tax=Paenibacillus sp. 1_12 TaxID=1566278 RepID=UPI0008F445FF|nr:hypothetical protein [Paenibacillus sp. 1_12]SFM13104.1 hypothetical protein SAMN03159341_11787 [Paenibacillus sp. 1_12]
MISNNSERFINILYYTFVFSVGFYLFYNEARIVNSDLYLHIRLTNDFFQNHLYIPHPGFHTLVYILHMIMFIDLTYSATIILSLCLVFISYIIYRIIEHFVPTLSLSWKIFITTGLILVSAIYLPFFNTSVYLGQWSPNVWHNPTLIALKPFAYISFFLGVNYFFYSETKINKRFLLLSIALVVSLIMKPNFLIAFLPALFIYLFIKKYKNLSWLRVFVMLCVPIIIVLIFQYWGYANTQKNDHMIFTFFGVWRLYSPNIFFSIILVTAFPLALYMLKYNECMKNHYLNVSWIAYIISVLQFSFLAEAIEFRSGNWAWGMMTILPILFLFSTIEFLKMWDRKKNSWKINILSLLFALHLCSGIYYFLKVITIHDYN